MTMKKISLLCYAILLVLAFAESANAASQIDTSNIYLMAYYKAAPEISLSTAIQEFDQVTESTGQYVEGKIKIWHNNVNGKSTNISDYEIRNGNVTNRLFSTNVTVRVKSDGWIVAWLTDQQDPNEIVFWNDVNSNTYTPPDTTIGQAIWRVTNRISANYTKSSAKYYSYKYQNADRLLISGSKTISSTPKTYYLMIPSSITLHEANILWSSYILDSSNSINGNTHGTIKIDGNDVYNKSTTDSYKGLYEYSRYAQQINPDISRDTLHPIYMKTSGSGSTGFALIKSAVMLLYKSG